MNPSNLGMAVLQVGGCKLPKGFSAPPIGVRDLVRQFTDEGGSRACCALLNFIVEVECVNYLSKW